MKKVFFKSNNNLQLCGIWHIPKNKTDKAIILAHGITADKDEDGAFVQLAYALSKSGFAVLRFDFFGHGESEGKSVDMTIKKEIKDLEAAVLEAKKEYSKIGLLGASFGGGTSVLYAEENQEKLVCLCLWNPVLNYEHTFLNPTLPWIRERIIHMAKDIQEKGWTTLGSKDFVVGKALFDEMKDKKPYEALKNITIPTLIVHGDKDKHVPYEDSKEYVQKLKDGKFITISNAEHGFNKKKETPQAIAETVCFFNNNF